MRSLSRIMLVVVFLLLPVFLTGASLELPGKDCGSLHCCLLSPCAGHDHADGNCPAEAHDHHHPAHGHILLLCDAGQRVDRAWMAAAVQPRVFAGPRFVPACLRNPAKGQVILPSLLFTGSLMPLRC